MELRDAALISINRRRPSTIPLVSALTVRGIHSMDMLCHCLGDFVEVSAKVATQVKQWRVTETGAMVDVDAADNVLVNGVLRGGAPASVHVATLPYHTTGWRMEIYGRGGTLRVSTKGSLQRDANTLLGSSAYVNGRGAWWSASIGGDAIQITQPYLSDAFTPYAKPTPLPS